jgi:LmbE family N-acetylglucosaminyl deacetylase
VIDIHKGVLGVTAHPDDEFMGAGSLCRLNLHGITTTLMCLTRGGRIRERDNVTSDDVLRGSGRTALQRVVRYRMTSLAGRSRAVPRRQIRSMY